MGRLTTSMAAWIVDRQASAASRAIEGHLPEPGQGSARVREAADGGQVPVGPAGRHSAAPSSGRVGMLSYALALGTTAGALASRWLLDPVLGKEFPFTLFYGAVAITVWFGGYRPAIVATGLGALSAAYVYLDPRGAAHRIPAPDAVGLAMYLVTCAIIVGLGDAARRARERHQLAAQEALAAQAELREADHQKDEFLAILSHELRNPLAPIRNAVEILRRLGSATPDIRYARDVIERQMQHLTRLIDDLLEVTRIRQGKVTLRRERVLLSSVVASALEIAGPIVEAAGHHLDVRLSDERLAVEGDRVRLSQVLANLLNNASKYTPSGGHIELRVRREDLCVVVSVRDNGTGIPPQMLSSIFDLFQQVDRPLERTAGGLGIGLTVVKRLVELHGGSIAAYSDGPGLGSEFVVRLPRAKA